MKKLLIFVMLLFSMTLSSCGLFDEEASFQDQLTNGLPKLEFEFTEKENDRIDADAGLTIKDCDDDFLLQLTYYKDSTLHIFLTGDKIDSTYQNLVAINNFNYSNSFVYAYITENNYLEVHLYRMHIASSEAGTQAAQDILDYFIEDDVKQLFSLTHK